MTDNNNNTTLSDTLPTLNDTLPTLNDTLPTLSDTLPTLNDTSTKLDTTTTTLHRDSGLDTTTTTPTKETMHSHSKKHYKIGFAQDKNKVLSSIYRD